jgi:hypothetical protein
MEQTHARPILEMNKERRNFYRAAIEALQGADVPFLIGGAYALKHYTGIARDTKDLDVFVRPKDSERLLKGIAAAGYRTEMTFTHWLGKAFHEEHYIDVIFSSGNGLCEVDDLWFDRAVQADIVGIPVGLTPPEEMIWSKSFVMERERFDGADVAHLIHASGPKLDWSHLLSRFGSHWRVLLSHLILFGFIYPREQSRIPDSVMMELLGRLENEMSRKRVFEQVCQGTLLSRAQYLQDTQLWGYRDARLLPTGTMTEKEVSRWTEAIATDATEKNKVPLGEESIPEATSKD